jgi:hypothetical protein
MVFWNAEFSTVVAGARLWKNRSSAADLSLGRALWHGRQTSRQPADYEFPAQSFDDCRKSFEQRVAPGFQNEFSGVVWKPFPPDSTIRASRKQGPCLPKHLETGGEIDATGF